jgi:hypothetical protein
LGRRLHIDYQCRQLRRALPIEGLCGQSEKVNAHGGAW